MQPLCLLLALTMQVALPSAQRARLHPTPLVRPNIVVIVADDFGVDLVEAYGEGAAPACMPNLSAFAAQGLLFRNAWANPVCSPSRAALMTGRYGFRTGIGDALGPMESGLSLAQTTLPEMLTGYASRAIGKWHLAGNLGNSHPNASGFDHFVGSLDGVLAGYWVWEKVIDGLAFFTMEYATTDVADEAIDALQSMQEPFFLYVAFNAPHSPYHAPPSALCPSPAVCSTAWCDSLPATPTNLEMGKAMIEAMDTELGRILDQIDAVDPDAWVFFLGDNGSAQQMSEGPFLPSHAKDTVYEGGLNVPLIVRGPSVVPGETQALVSVVDLYATLAELAGVGATTEDSVSFAACFHDPLATPRTSVYSEVFTPNNGTLPFTDHRRAVRRTRFKLIRSTGLSDEFYDLLTDPFETTNLLPGLTPFQQNVYNALVGELVALGVD